MLERKIIEIIYLDRYTLYSQGQPKQPILS